MASFVCNPTSYRQTRLAWIAALLMGAFLTLPSVLIADDAAPSLEEVAIGWDSVFAELNSAQVAVESSISGVARPKSSSSKFSIITDVQRGFSRFRQIQFGIEDVKCVGCFEDGLLTTFTSARHGPLPVAVTVEDCDVANLDTWKGIDLRSLITALASIRNCHGLLGDGEWSYLNSLDQGTLRIESLDDGTGRFAIEAGCLMGGESGGLPAPDYRAVIEGDYPFLPVSQKLMLGNRVYSRLDLEWEICESLGTRANSGNRIVWVPVVRTFSAYRDESDVHKLTKQEVATMRWSNLEESKYELAACLSDLDYAEPGTPVNWLATKVQPSKLAVNDTTKAQRDSVLVLGEMCQMEFDDLASYIRRVNKTEISVNELSDPSFGRILFLVNISAALVLSSIYLYRRHLLSKRS